MKRSHALKVRRRGRHTHRRRSLDRRDSLPYHRRRKRSAESGHRPSSDAKPAVAHQPLSPAHPRGRPGTERPLTHRHEWLPHADEIRALLRRPLASIRGGSQRHRLRHRLPKCHAVAQSRELPRSRRDGEDHGPTKSRCVGTSRSAG